MHLTSLRCRSGFTALAFGLLSFLCAPLPGKAAQGQAASCRNQTEPALREAALRSGELDISDHYLSCFPYGDGAISVKEHRDKIQEEAQCKAASASSNPEELRSFILAWSGSECAKQVAARLLQLRNSSNFIQYRNTMLVGTASKQGTADDVVSCSSTCQASGESCVGYSFDTGQKICTLWSAVQSRTPRGNTESGSLKQLPVGVPANPAPTAPAQPQPPQAASMQYGNGIDLPGGDYARYDAMPFQQCNALCLASPQCLAFTYNTAAQVCFLKSRVGSSIQAQNAVSGVKSAAAALGAPANGGSRITNLMSNIDLPNDDLSLDYAMLRQIPLSACQQQCNDDRQCAAFTYNHERSACILKRGFGRRQMFYGATSGIKQ